MRSIAHITAAAAVATLVGPAPATGQTELCAEAERFVHEIVGMVAVSEPDTIDDWRTRAMVPGCRVTAAGAMPRSGAEQVRLFYQVLNESGWIRTPDPRDAPNEASLRFRKDGADCLFNYYDSSTSLNTEAELAVTDAVVLGPGDRLFNFLILCTPAGPAAPRGQES